MLYRHQQVLLVEPAISRFAASVRLLALESNKRKHQTANKAKACKASCRLCFPCCSLVWQQTRRQVERAGQLTHGGASMGDSIRQHSARGVLVLHPQYPYQQASAEVNSISPGNFICHCTAAWQATLVLVHNCALTACSSCTTCGGATSPQTLTFQRMLGVY